MAATPASTIDLIDLIIKSGLITAENAAALGNLPEEPTACAAALIAKGVITKFQAKLLLNGRYKGFKLGPYIIREQIGQGGMGAVYSAEHETLKRRVALKVLTVPRDGNAKLSIERFLREARAAAALDHPNIVRLHDIGKSDSTHYIVMEYVEGQTLDQIITRSGSISSSRAVEYIAQAAAGLQHAYERGFIHRDIKPGNLMLAKDGTVKLLDMGLARAAETEESDKLTEVMDKGAIVGTADFISPEQAMNAKLDIRSDIYSLGATFFALVTGSPPFSGNTTQKLIQHQMKEAPSVTTLDRTFPTGLSLIVAKMLAKKPESRFQTPADVIKALAEWIPQQASGKMSAAISRTDLAQSEEMQTTLSEIASGTKRLGSQGRLNRELESATGSRWKIPSIAAAILLIAGGATAAIMGALPKGEDSVTTNARDLGAAPVAVASTVPTEPFTPPTPRKAPPKVEAKRPVTVAKEPPLPVSVEPAALPPALYRMDLSAQKPFAERGHMVIPANSSVKKWIVDEHTGDGNFPAGWSGNAYGSENAVVEFAARSVDGKFALGARNLEGNGGAMIMTPKFDCPTGKFILSFDAMVEAPNMIVKVRFVQQKPAKKQAADVTATTTMPAGEWKTFTKEFDSKSGTGGFLEFHPTGKREFAWIRNLSIRSAGGGTDTPDRNAVIFTTNFESMKPAFLRTEKAPKTFTTRLIEGQTLAGAIHINQHRPDVSAEYSITSVDGVRALGLKLLEGDYGCQFHCPCADAFNQLNTGEALKVRLTYRFEGTGQGTAAVQISTSPYTKFAGVKLPPTGPRWATVEVNFTKPATAGNYEFIANCTDDSSKATKAIGTIYFRQIDVYYPDAVIK